MPRFSKLVPAALLLALPACYHATIDTGLTPSTTVVEKAWASSFIGGLVPPSTVETQSKCRTGVSKVETQLSFLNMLVGFITLSIYTPMDIKVTCAQGGRSSIPSGASTLQVGASASPDALQKAFRQAAELSIEHGTPVYVAH